MNGRGSRESDDVVFNYNETFGPSLSAEERGAVEWPSNVVDG